MPAAVKLHAANFVPLTRTPWAGKLIAALKAGAVPGLGLERRIGESWDVSTDAEFPSRVLAADGGSDGTLAEWIAAAPEARLGALTFRRFGAHCPLLLKWLNADLALSVQVHPANGHPGLTDGQCGKPEAWYVAHSEPGAFVYLGLRHGVSHASLQAALAAGRPDDVLFRYAPQPGDYIRVPTGCVHAVGRGLLLLEPQAVQPSAVPQTWRLYDWGRKYGPSGELDEVHGERRPVHLAAGLSAIDWQLPREQEFLQRFLTRLERDGQLVEATSANPFSLRLMTGGGVRPFVPPLDEAFAAVSVVGGAWRWEGGSGDAFSLFPGDVAFFPPQASGRLLAELAPGDDKQPCALSISLDAALVPN